MKTDMARGLTDDEEYDSARLSKQVEARQTTLVKLGKDKSEVSTDH